MIAILLLAALAQAPAPSPLFGGLAPGAGARAPMSPVAGAIDFTSFYSSTYGPGIPDPTIDCISNGTGYDCVGATATPGGSGTTAGTSPFWAAGASATKAATVYNGSGWHNLGDVANQTGAFTIVAKVKPSGAAAWAISRDGVHRSYVVYDTGSGLRLYSFKDDSTACVGVEATYTANTWNVFVVTFNGSSSILTSLNGVELAAVTTCTGASQSVGADTPLVLGADSSGASRWTGAMGRVSIWTGFNATAAQRATMAASQMSLLATKPSGTLATHARSDSTLCCPLRDSECYWLAPNVPCVRSDPDSTGRGVGVEVYGIGQNLLLQTLTVATGASIFENAAWTKDAGVVVADASASCPLGPLGARMSLVTGDGDGEGVSQDEASGTARSVWMAYATGGSTCNVTLSDYSGDGAAAVALTAVPVRSVQAAAGQTGLKVAKPTDGCATWCMWAPQTTATLMAKPFRSTTSAAYTGSAGTATTEQEPVPGTVTAGQWALSLTAIPGAGWGGSPGLWTLGTYGAANSADAYVTAGAVIIEVYDAAAGWKRWTASETLSGTTAKTILVGYAAGAVSASADGVPLTLSTSGAGTGILGAMPSAVTWGVAGSSYLSGGFSAQRICKRFGGCR